MKNLEKYNNLFCEIFCVEDNVLNENFNRESVGDWDSVRQLALVNAIEETFDIMLDTEDILGLTSYEIGKKILMKNNIELK